MASTAFDIMNQTFNLTDYDGQVIEQHTAGIVDNQHIAVSTATVFATQLGLTAAVLAILLITASAHKYRTVTFWLNASALVCNIARCGLQCALMDGPLSNFVVVVLGAYNQPGVKQAVSTSVTCTMFQFGLFAFIQSSLILQVGVIFSSGPRFYRQLALLVVLLVAAMALAWRVNLALANIRFAFYLADYDTAMALMEAQAFAQLAANVTTIVSLGLSSAIFTGKVGYMIWKRREMGLRSFDKYQIMFIISFQTLLFPVIIAAIACFVLKGIQLQSCVETLIAIFLPLSSIWSSANIQARISARHPAAMLQLPSYHSAESHFLQPSESNASMALTAQPIDHAVRRERSFWEQYGSHDSVMLDNLESSATVATYTASTAPTSTIATVDADGTNILDRSLAENAARAETTLYFLDLAGCDKASR